MNQLADLDSVPNQIGAAVIRSSDGTFLRPPSGLLSEHDAFIIYQMLMEVGHINSGQDHELGRVNVEGVNGVSYSACVDKNGFVYIVKRQTTTA